MNRKSYAASAEKTACDQVSKVPAGASVLEEFCTKSSYQSFGIPVMVAEKFCGEWVLSASV